MASNGPNNENISTPTEGQTEPKDGANAEVNFQDLTQFMQTFFQQMQDKFQVASDQILGKNLMSQRIDELERNITELSNQAAVEEQQPPPSAKQ